MAITIDGTDGISPLKASGQTQTTTGTAASPAIASSSDTDTGFFFGTNEVNISTGGSTRAKVDSSGNVGIGTTSPSKKLHGDSSADQIRLSDGSGGFELRAGNVFKISDDGTERIRVDGSGQLGIGSQSPDAELHVGGSEPHIDVGPDSGNRGKIGYKSNDLFFGTSSSAGEFIFKNNVGSTDHPDASGTARAKLESNGGQLFAVVST